MTQLGKLCLSKEVSLPNKCIKTPHNTGVDKETHGSIKILI